MKLVITGFNNFPAKFYKLKDCLNADEVSYLQKVLTARFQFVYGDAHDIAYLLDPRYVGAGLHAHNWQELEVLIVSLSEYDKEPASEDLKLQLNDQFTQYIIRALRNLKISLNSGHLNLYRKSRLQYCQSDIAWPDL